MKGFTSCVVFGLCAGLTYGWNVEVCSDSPNIMGVQDAKIPIMTSGGEVDIELKHIPKENVEKGMIRVDLIVEGIKVHSEVRDLCEVVEDCHAHAHHFSLSKLSMSIPDHVPEGFQNSLRVVYNDHNGKLLTCAEMHDVKVQRKSTDEHILFAESNNGKKLGLSRPELDFLFEKWSAEHGISYPQSEIAFRKKVFADNFQSVALHNLEGHSYSKAMNQFGAITPDEFRKSYFGLNLGIQNRTSFEINDGILSRKLDDLPTSIDWVEKGAVTPVKNQGACGSCWAFSTTGALEGAYFLKTGKLVSFSEQELVACDKTDQGCNGGLMDNADAWIQQNGGLCKEEDYPYTARGSVCKSCQIVEGSTPKAVHDLVHTQQALAEALTKQPVSIAIEADQLAFQFYSKGVLTGTCGEALDHGVLAVGFGEMGSTKYWKVKNSWGPSWGLNGYILLERGKPVTGGECGLLLSASYPEL